MNTQYSRKVQQWRSAMPIQKAYLELAPTALAQKLEALSDATLMHVMQKASSVSNAKNLNFLMAMTEVMKDAQPRLEEKRRIESEIDSHNFHQLRSGQVRCFAFEFPRTFQSEPIEMLPQHWTAYPDWKKGEFKANGLHLIELRVLPKDLAPVIEDSRASTAPGRPTIKPFIQDAFTELHRAGKIDTNQSARHHYSLIRDWIERNVPDDNKRAAKISDEGIRLHFSPLFNALKKNRKQ